MAKVIHRLQNLLALFAGGIALVVLSPVILLYVLFSLFGLGQARSS
jgi:hypothetical protein